MKTYIVRWTQILSDEFTVQANSVQEAIALVENGEYGDVDMIVDNYYGVVEEREMDE